MRIIVTCGPSYEPIDEVRRLTNFSTGDLGVRLANRLARAGHEVICCKGVAATCARAVEGARVVGFTTNDRLRERLAELESPGTIGAVFHAAALCDFKTARVTAADGTELSAAKIPSRQAGGGLCVWLEPARKLIAELRDLFPGARLVGWKYELDGTREDALAKARAQIAENRTDACVANGTAYGPGFGFCAAGSEQVEHLATKDALCEFLAGWVAP